MVKIPDHPPALPSAAGIALGVAHSKVEYLDADPQLHNGAMRVRLEARSFRAKEACAQRVINSPDTNWHLRVPANAYVSDIYWEWIRNIV
jgi:hypothetical protein